MIEQRVRAHGELQHPSRGSSGVLAGPEQGGRQGAVFCGSARAMAVGREGAPGRCSPPLAHGNGLGSAALAAPVLLNSPASGGSGLRGNEGAGGGAPAVT